MLRPQEVAATLASVATSVGSLTHRGFRKTNVFLKCDLLAQYSSQVDIFILFFPFFIFQFINVTQLIMFKRGCRFFHPK